MTREPRWLPHVVVIALHHDQLLERGGSYGVRDRHRLDAALAHPRSAWSDDPSVALPALAAANGHGLCAARPLVAGNGGTALVAMYALLGLNGLRVVASGEDAQGAMRAVAFGEMGEAALADWVAAGVVAR